MYREAYVICETDSFCIEREECANQGRKCIDISTMKDKEIGIKRICGKNGCRGAQNGV